MIKNNAESVERDLSDEFKVGPDEFWVCPFCGQRVPFDAQMLNFIMTCPTCGGLMTPK
ncbi:hypothetical protein ACFLT2_13600 [Acidobacteriota bacterium]